MKKLLLAITATLALSTPMTANAMYWEYYSHNQAMLQSHQKPNKFITLFNKEGKVDFIMGEVFTDKNTSCINGESVIKNIDNQPITFIKRSGKNICLYITKNEAANTYILNYFSKQGEDNRLVSVDGAMFVTFDYNDVYNNIKKAHNIKVL